MSAICLSEPMLSTALRMPFLRQEPAAAEARPDEPLREPTSPVTVLLRDWQQGDRDALDRLLPLVYTELRRLARGYLRRERAGHTLQPTALIHEAYVRLIPQSDRPWQSRSHFIAVAAQLMRQILMEYARSHRAAKRGGGEQKAVLNEGLLIAGQRSEDLVALDDALRDLARFDARKAKVIELRYFGGLSVEETAEVLGVSVATVGREARMAVAWLAKVMEGGAPGVSGQ
jgi:RNA polymerase sigma factor (TIGR02999 family)